MCYRRHDSDVLLRKPNWNDGAAIYQLIKRCPPLDLNSEYSYHLLARHFTDTCVVAESRGEVVGFISAYLEPEAPQTLFVWQVAVDASQRGKGIAGLMLSSLIARPGCEGVNFVEATVSPDNIASRKVFAGVAERLDTELLEEGFLDADDFSAAGHDAECLLRVGPLNGEQQIQEKRYANY